MTLGRTSERLRSDLDFPVVPLWGLELNNIVNPALVDNQGEMHDCYVAPGTKLSVGKGSVLCGCRFTGKEITIGENCVFMNVDLACSAEFKNRCKALECEFFNRSEETAAKHKLSFGDGCQIKETRIHGKAQGAGASLTVGNRACIQADSFDLAGSVRIGDDFCLDVCIAFIDTNVFIGNRVSVAARTNNFRSYFQVQSKSAHIGDDVRVIHSLVFRSCDKLTIGDRSLLIGNGGLVITLGLSELTVGTEAVMVFDTNLSARRGRGMKIKVGGRGRLEVYPAMYRAGALNGVGEITVASNEKLSLGV